MNLRLLGCRTALMVCHAMIHGHHRGLAGARGQLQRHPQELRVRLQAGALQALQCLLLPLSQTRSNLGEPDQSLHRLHLAEEGR